MTASVTFTATMFPRFFNALMFMCFATLTSTTTSSRFSTLGVVRALLGLMLAL